MTAATATVCECRGLSQAEHWCGTRDCPRCGNPITGYVQIQRVLLYGADGLVFNPGHDGINHEATLERCRDIMGADEECGLSFSAMDAVVTRWPVPDHPNLRERYQFVLETREAMAAAEAAAAANLEVEP